MFASVRASLALESIARTHGAELLVLNDVDPVLLRQTGLRPGFTPCPGTEDVMVVPEGDLGGGLACFILGKLTGQAVSFFEPFHIDRRNGSFAAGHAGPNDYTDPTGKTILSTDTRFAKSSYRYAGAPFAWHLTGPGEKTFLHISQCGAGFKMVVSVMDALPADHFLAGYSHGVFKPRIPAEELFTKLQNTGVTQHYGVTAGDHTTALEILAELLGFDFYRI
jgi:L-arabinose isomerase